VQTVRSPPGRSGRRARLDGRDGRDVARHEPGGLQARQQRLQLRALPHAHAPQHVAGAALDEPARAAARALASACARARPTYVPGTPSPWLTDVCGTQHLRMQADGQMHWCVAGVEAGRPLRQAPVAQLGDVELRASHGRLRKAPQRAGLPAQRRRQHRLALRRART